MKNTLIVIILFLTCQLTAQDLELQPNIEFVKLQIQQTQKAERLYWLDSLTKLTYHNTKLNYEDSVRETIDFAIALDSLNLASKKVAELMGFQNNFLGKPEEGLKLFNVYINKLKKEIGPKSIGYVYLNLADSHYYLGDIDASFTYYNIAKQHAKNINDERLYGFAVMYTGYNESEKGMFAESSKNLKEAAQIFTKLKDTLNILGAKNALAILYSKNNFFKEAKTERDEAIILAKNVDSYSSLRNLYNNAAEDYEKTGDAVNQIASLKKSIEANSKLSNAFLVRTELLTKLIKAYVQSNNLKLAELHFKDVGSDYLEDKSDKNRMLYIDALRWISFGKEDYSSAITYGHEYLQAKKQHSNYEEVMLAEKFLGKMYALKNDDKSANKHLLNYYMIKDSISNVQNVKSLVYYQTLYETEKRDLEIANQKANISLLNFQNKSKTQVLIFGSLAFLILFGGSILYRTYRNTKKRELAQQEFSQQLIATQEQERTRIAKDLHDSVGQQITLFKMKAQNSNQPELSSLANIALEEVRSISRNLYPATLKKLGLTDSIEQLLIDLDEETDLFFSVEIDDVNTVFNDLESLNFYRFIQESVSNVIKHAKAKTLIVNIIKQSDGIKVLIKDNGQGFEVSKMIKQNSLGLKTMAERISMLKGHLSIKSKNHGGTSILVQIPT